MCLTRTSSFWWPRDKAGRSFRGTRLSRARPDRPSPGRSSRPRVDRLRIPVSAAAGAGCNPNLAYMNPSGGARAIAIVDAFHDDMAATDLAFFSNQFGLPAATFQQHSAQPGSSCSNTEGPVPPADPTGGWEVEESLDIQWAHAMAPNATILLVEAQSNSNANLLCAEQYAGFLLQAFGGGEASNSWGGGEGAGEPPATRSSRLPTWCTSLRRAILRESSIPALRPTWSAWAAPRWDATPTRALSWAWNRTGRMPAAASAGLNRGRAISHSASAPHAACRTFRRWPTQHWRVGAGHPCIAPGRGMVRSRRHQRGVSGSGRDRECGRQLLQFEQLRAQPDLQRPDSNFNDILAGTCGLNIGFSAGPGWDFCTGRGSPRGYAGK